MRRIEEIEIESVTNRSMIPTGATGIFYVENEDVVVVKT